MTKLGLPTWATTILGLGAGVLAVLNELTFGFSTEWRGYLSVALIFLAGIGISPLVGPAFRAALHLSTSVSLVITAALSALALAVHTFNIGEGWRGVLQGVLAFAAAVGFAPNITLVQAKRVMQLSQTVISAMALMVLGAVVLGVLG